MVPKYDVRDRMSDVCLPCLSRCCCCCIIGSSIIIIIIGAIVAVLVLIAVITFGIIQSRRGGHARSDVHHINADMKTPQQVADVNFHDAARGAAAVHRAQKLDREGDIQAEGVGAPGEAKYEMVSPRPAELDEHQQIDVIVTDENYIKK